MDAVGPDNHLGIANTVLNVTHHGLKLLDHADIAQLGQNDAGIDGAEESQAEVIVKLLNGTHVEVLTEAHTERVQRKRGRVQLVQRQSHNPAVLRRGRLGVDFQHHTPLRIGPGHHHLFSAGSEVVPGDDTECTARIDQQQDRRVTVKNARVIDVGVAKIQAIARGTAQQGHATQGIGQEPQHDFFANRHAVQQRERETLTWRHRHGAPLQGVDTLLYRAHHLFFAEKGEVIEQHRLYGEMTPRQTEGGNGIGRQAALGYLTGRGAANERSAGEAALQGR